MADIVVTTDFSQLNSMNKALGSTDTLFVKVVDSILREVNRAKRVTKALAETTEENLKIVELAEIVVAAKVEEAAARREKARQREAARAEKEAERIRRAKDIEIAAEIAARQEREKTAATKAQNFQNQIGPNLGLGARGISAGASASAFEAEIERLRQKYDSVYVASQLYESSLKELDLAHGVGVLSANRYKAAVDQLNLEYQQFANAAEGAVIANNRFSQHVNESGRGLNKFGMVSQQIGYQVGDFFVQIQSGTNALVAFGQQATQLAGLIPGVWGAAIGIGISIATAFGAAWMRTSEGVEQGAKQQEDALKSLRQELDRYVKEKEAANLGVTPEQTLSAEALVKAQNDLIAANQKLQDMQAVTNISGAAYANNTGAALANMLLMYFAASDVEAAIKAQADAQATVNDLRDRMLDSYEEESRNLANNAQLEVARIRFGEESLKYKALVAEQERKNYEESLRSLGVNEGYIIALMNQYDQTIKNREEAEKARAEAERFRNTLLSIANIDISSVFKNASGPLNNLLEGAGKLLDKAVALAYISANQPGGKSYMANQYALYGQGKVSSRETVAEAGPLYTPFPVPDVTGGGGGGSQQEDALQKLREQLALENELLGVSEAQKRVIQALGDQRSNYHPKEIQMITAEIEAYDRKLQALEQQQQLAQTMQSSMETAFMSIVSGTESAKDAFKKMAYEMIKELYRVLVVQRMVGQFQSGGGGILGGLFGFLGRGPSTGTLGLPKFASGGSMMPGKPYLVGEQGPEIVVPRHSGTVVNAQQSANAMGNGGGVTVQNNITVTGSDAAMVRAEVAKMIPQITNATKAAVIDARLRGGQMKAAFS